MTRVWIAAACCWTACSFRPSLDGTPLVDCVVDADCPRGALCVAQVCVPQPLTVTSLTATPEVVEAGEECGFAATAAHSLREERLRYRWHQVLGPDVELRADGSTVSLTTRPDYVGSYAVEVIVENGRDLPARGRVHCTALISSDAEFVVAGQSGDCSRERPCGSVSDTSARRVYVGVDETSSTQTWTYSVGGGFDNRELHGGFVFPGWRRDMERARTSVTSSTSTLYLSCSSCLFSGITQERIFPDENNWQRAIQVDSAGVTLREVLVFLRGGGDDISVSGVAASDPAVDSVALEGVRVVADGVRAEELWGLDMAGVGLRVIDTEIDLRDGESAKKWGVEVGQQVEPLLLDRVRIHLGDANEARGLVVRCASGRIVNTIVDVRGEGSGFSEALHIDSPIGCPTGGRIHSSLFVGGGGANSYGARLLDPEPSFDVLNTIIDGGQGFSRVGLDTEGLDQTIDMAGTVIVLEGGEGGRDHWVRSASAGLPVDAFEAAIGCAGCLSTTGDAGFFDAGAGDYHLTEASDCCIDTGAPLASGDPARDYDGVARDPGAPAVGPYELVTY